ncbi:ClcB-like voltage-gated chloride channel protein [Duganella vulcania]|uniref:ClcB-like voltage-gated chloride channel protein n=1 Tax=Duganella vulcania TaxID=2692166 RepID=A0A845GTM0_9BURK|nr:ClcB-like voltage-gated chloride channel protein [Duganella vulcania]MYM97065.1 ClcB-like voltage-gated chloride channel protein [Duganella vulcania]
MTSQLTGFSALVKRLPRFAGAPAMMLWAGLVGMAGALATIAFREGLAGMQWLLVGHSGSFVEMAAALPWQMRMLLPAAGGVVAGLFLVFAKRYAANAPADYMEAVALGDGRISVRQTLLNSASSLCTIASGGSIGREGSMVQLAAMCASSIGRLRRFDAPRLRLLVACGAAAGITAAYNAPIASAFFVTEIVLGTMVMDSLGPIMIASVMANITMRRFPNYRPTYEMPALTDVPNGAVPLFIALGIIAGLIAPQFLRLLALSKRTFETTALPLPARLGVGGLLVGIVSVWVPQVWGNGYSVVNSMLHSPWLWSSVLTVLICKVIATMFTTGSGAIGGIFTPTLFLGAAIGQLFGQAVIALWPAVAPTPAIFVIVGMGAVLAAATGAPLMAILMIFEMTLSYHIMLPLMLACVLAYFLARGIGSPSMYAITSIRSRDERERLRLLSTQMRELIRPAETVVTLGATLDDITAMFRVHPVKYVYVVDDAQLFQGVVALSEVAAAVADGTFHRSLQAADLLRRDFLATITPEMSLDEAFEQFNRHHGERLPAVESRAKPVLLGAVYKTDLLDAYVRLNRSTAP